MKKLPLEQHPAGTLGALERYTGTNRIPIGRSRGDGCACDIVAEVSGGGGVVGQTDGDKLAALFTAAPELLAALRETLTQAEHYGPKDRAELGGQFACDVIERARAAIAKATGN